MVCPERKMTFLVSCMLIWSVLVQFSLVDGFFWGDSCDVLPVEGCTCHAHHGIHVPCVDLGLSAFPDVNPASGEPETVHSLDLSRNAISYVQPQTTSVAIQNLAMNNNNGANFSSNFFNSLPQDLRHSLESIEINNAGLTEFPNVSNGFSALRKLSLMENFISVLNLDALNQLSSLTELYLAGNPIQVVIYLDISEENGRWDLQLFDFSFVGDIGSSLLYNIGLLTRGRLRDLSIRDSPDNLLPQFLWEYPRLQSLAWTGCELDDVFTNRVLPEKINGNWSGYETLRNVDLARNRLTEVPCRLLRPMHRLLSLDLSHNVITRVRAFSFRDNAKLTYIDLSSNHIRVVETNAFYRNDVTKLIKEINLQNNRLLTLDEASLPGSFPRSTALLIGGNPWSCDCDIQWLVDLIGREAAGEPGPLDPYEVFHDLRCGGPSSMTGSLLLDLYRDRSLFCYPYEYAN